MKFIKISNTGELDIDTAFIVGLSTKTNDPGKIGKFGSGLKYAIAYLIRNDIPFHFYNGLEEIVIESATKVSKTTSYSVLVINGKETTTSISMGFHWTNKMAMRELFSNAIDQGTKINEFIIVEEEDAIKEENKVNLYVSTDVLNHEEFSSFLQEIIRRFDSTTAFTITPDKEYIYKEKPVGKGKIFSNGVDVSNDNIAYYKFLFDYDFPMCSLSEDRKVYNGYNEFYWAMKNILNTTEESIDLKVIQGNLIDIFKMYIDHNVSTMDFCGEIKMMLDHTISTESSFYKAFVKTFSNCVFSTEMSSSGNSNNLTVSTFINQYGELVQEESAEQSKSVKFIYSKKLITVSDKIYDFVKKNFPGLVDTAKAVLESATLQIKDRTNSKSVQELTVFLKNGNMSIPLTAIQRNTFEEAKRLFNSLLDHDPFEECYCSDVCEFVDNILYITPDRLKDKVNVFNVMLYTTTGESNINRLYEVLFYNEFKLSQMKELLEKACDLRVFTDEMLESARKLLNGN